mmetsp:Transcript_43059/g.51672  ORF Transcript_43059/g.51672 Transcript_43059/m.51672 type:complete len:302 (+) Transcript_43059:81-986(+)
MNTSLNTLDETFQILDPRAHLKHYTSHNVRPDGRTLHAVRPTTVLHSVVPRNTRGSALIRLGQTRVMAATTLLVGQPSASRPDCGSLEITCALGPVCSPQYNEMGRVNMGEGDDQNKIPMADASTIESFVQRTLSSSGMINYSDLCITPNKFAWKIRVSIVCLNHDGNVEDAALLAAVAALGDTTLPSTILNEQTGLIETTPSSGNQKPLKLHCIPIPLTIGYFDNILMADPTLDEESVLDSMVTIVMSSTNEDGEDGGHLISVNKPGGRSMTARDLGACMQMALGRVKEMELLISKRQTE